MDYLLVKLQSIYSLFQLIVYWFSADFVAVFLILCKQKGLYKIFEFKNQICNANFWCYCVRLQNLIEPYHSVSSIKFNNYPTFWEITLRVVHQLSTEDYCVGTFINVFRKWLFLPHINVPIYVSKKLTSWVKFTVIHFFIVLVTTFPLFNVWFLKNLSNNCNKQEWFIR